MREQAIGPGHSNEKAVGPPANADTQGKGDGKRQALLTVNNLQYLLEPDLSIAVNATHKKHFFQNATYTDQQTAVCVLNSGADYIDTNRSYLHLDLTNTSADNQFNFGDHGSILNIFKRLTITSRSGDELCRITDLNVLAQTCHPYQYDRQFFLATGGLYGFGAENIPGQSAETRSFCIPLYLLCDLLGYGRLIPAPVMAGMRFEFEFEDPKTAFLEVTGANSFVIQNMTTGVPGDLEVDDKVWVYRAVAAAATPAASGYSISQIYFNMKSVQLTDAAQRALNELSAVNGLELVYSDWETTEYNSSNSTQNIEVRKAASRALKALVRQRPTANITNSLTDSFRAAEFDTVEYQWQLGSLYFPQQPVKHASAINNSVESYAQTLDCFDKLQPSSRPPLTILKNDARDFREHHQTFQDGACTIGVTLERSSLFNNSGIPINNARILAFNQTRTAATAVTSTVFLKYVKMARVFLNNIEVEV